MEKKTNFCRSQSIIARFILCNLVMFLSDVNLIIRDRKRYEHFCDLFVSRTLSHTYVVTHIKVIQIFHFLSFV